MCGFVFKATVDSTFRKTIHEQHEGVRLP